jgi:mannose/fructose/N-acetylgalactosamine-specific phosphotransferase system component IIC
VPYRCSLRHISTRRLAACAGRLKTRSSHGATESVATCIATMLYVYHHKDKAKSAVADQVPLAPAGEMGMTWFKTLDTKFSWLIKLRER